MVAVEGVGTSTTFEVARVDGQVEVDPRRRPSPGGRPRIGRAVRRVHGRVGDASSVGSCGAAAASADQFEQGIGPALGAGTGPIGGGATDGTGAVVGSQSVAVDSGRMAGLVGAVQRLGHRLDGTVEEQSIG